MIVSVEDSGVLELFWRHPVSMHPNRRKAIQFLSAFGPAIGQLRHIDAYLSLAGAQRSSDSGAQELAARIASGEIVVLEQKGEPRWPGTRLFVQPLSSSILLLARTASDSARSDHQARHWLNEAEQATLEQVFTSMCVRYRRATESPASAQQCYGEIERLLDTGELVPVYHPLPVYVVSAVAAAPANSPPAPRSDTPLPERDTFDAGLAGREQAGALMGAADEAAAVCEVCNRAREARATKQRSRKHWIEIQLVAEDGIPVPDVEYRVTLPNGEVVTGRLDANGSARVDRIEQAGNCKVAFPELDDREWELWR